MPTQWSREKYFKALKFAAEAHKGQLVPGSDLPYVVHMSLVAMEIIAALTEEEVDRPNLAVQCALLHDCLEDTYVIYDELTDKFGRYVADGVLALSKDGAIGTTEDEYTRDRLQLEDSLQRIKKQPREIWMVKLADRITNLQPPPSHWNDEKIQRYKEGAELIHKELASASEYLGERLGVKIDSYPEGDEPTLTEHA
jgi:(p)ppGpp synthase/HD superfamily hydrolase